MRHYQTGSRSLSTSVARHLTVKTGLPPCQSLPCYTCRLLAGMLHKRRQRPTHLASIGWHKVGIVLQAKHIGEGARRHRSELTRTPFPCCQIGGETAPVCLWARERFTWLLMWPQSGQYIWFEHLEVAVRNVNDRFLFPSIVDLQSPMDTIAI